MKEWEVTLPIVGTAHLTVDAETEELAIEKAMELVSFKDFDEWAAVHHVVQGSVCYAPTWTAEATCVSEEAD